MDIGLCDSNGKKKQVKPINMMHTKKEINISISIFTVFFFKDVQASIELAKNSF